MTIGPNSRPYCARPHSSARVSLKEEEREGTHEVALATQQVPLATSRTSTEFDRAEDSAHEDAD